MIRHTARVLLSALRRRPVFPGKDLLSLLSGALALIRQLPMLGSQLPKGGSRIDVADRFRDAREKCRLSAVVGRTIHVWTPAIFHAATSLKGRSPDQGGHRGGWGNGRGLPPQYTPRGYGGAMDQT
jgi:hypothetical protein